MIVLKATQEKVLGVLQSVAGIVERRHTLPILANVLIRKTAGQLQFTVAGHPLRNLRVVMGPMAASPLQVMISRTAP